MLYYDRIDITRGIDNAKSNNSNQYIFYYNWFLNHGFEFQDYI